MECCIGGYLVTEGPAIINNIDYYGMDTNAWPIGISPLEGWVPDICDKALADLSFPLLLDYYTALRYYTMCKRTGIIPRLLYCVAIANHCESVNLERLNSLPCSFLGFDYAYPSGDYYSAIANDIIYEKGCLSSQWNMYLNRYGLFSEEETIRAFAKSRTTLLRNGACNKAVESGIFTIFAVFEIENIDSIKE